MRILNEMDDRSTKHVTWERENITKTNFPNFTLEECNVLKRGVC